MRVYESLKAAAYDGFVWYDTKDDHYLVRGTVNGLFALAIAKKELVQA